MSSRAMLAMMAACCVGPMLLIVVLVSVLGVAIGPAAAITLGLVAGVLCVALMISHHRRAEGPRAEAAPPPS